MKRNMLILLVLLLIAFSLISCSSASKKDSPESLIKQFIGEMYSVEDYKKLDIENLEWHEDDNQYNNELKKIATEEALKPFVLGRQQLGYFSICKKLHINCEVASANIKKYLDNGDGSIIYSYKGKVNLTFVDENKQKKEDFEGQITVKEINSKWTIIKFNNVDWGCISKYYLKTKQ